MNDRILAHECLQQRCYSDCDAITNTGQDFEVDSSNNPAMFEPIVANLMLRVVAAAVSPQSVLVVYSYLGRHQLATLRSKSDS